MQREPSVNRRLRSYPISVRYRGVAPMDRTKHQHMGLELHHCCLGDGYFVVAGGSWPLTPCAVTLLDAQYEHEVFARGIPDYQRTVVEFLPSLIDGHHSAVYSAFSHILPSPQQPVRQFVLSGDTHARLNLLLAQVDHEFNHRAAVSLTVLSRHIVHILSSLSDVRQRRSIERNPSPYELLTTERAIACVDAWLGEKFCITDIAEQLGISAGHLRRVFRGVKGVALREYVHYRRLGLAQSLLAKGASVTETADRCGYLQVSSLSRAHRRLLGQSPSEL